MVDTAYLDSVDAENRRSEANMAMEYYAIDVHKGGLDTDYNPFSGNVRVSAYGPAAFVSGNPYYHIWLGVQFKVEKCFGGPEAPPPPPPPTDF